MARRRADLAVAALAVLLVLSSLAAAITFSDAASFYAYPWEVPSFVQVNYTSLHYLLVLANVTNQTGGSPSPYLSPPPQMPVPVALLLWDGNETFQPVYDNRTLFPVLYSASALVQNLTGMTFIQAADSIYLAQDRKDYASANAEYYQLNQQYYAFYSDWQNLSGSYSGLRSLQLPAMYPLLAKMNDSLQNMQESFDPTTKLGYSNTFEGYYLTALSLYDSYDALFPYYQQAVVTLLNSSLQINDSLRYQVITPQQAVQYHHRVDAVWSTVDYAEAQLIRGQDVQDTAEPLLEQATANATLIINDAQLKYTPPPDYTWAYAAAIVLAVLLAAGAAVYVFFIRQKPGGKPGEGGAASGLKGQIEDVFSKLRQIDKL